MIRFAQSICGALLVGSVCMAQPPATVRILGVAPGTAGVLVRVETLDSTPSRILFETGFETAEGYRTGALATPGAGWGVVGDKMYVDTVRVIRVPEGEEKRD